MHRIADAICRCVRQKQLQGESAHGAIAAYCAVCAGASWFSLNRREGIAFVVRALVLELLRVSGTPSGSDAMVDDKPLDQWWRTGTEQFPAPSDVQVLGIRCLCCALHAALFAWDPLTGMDAGAPQKHPSSAAGGEGPAVDGLPSFSDAYLQNIDGGGHTLVLLGAFDGSASSEARWLRGASTAASKMWRDANAPRSEVDVAAMPVRLRKDEICTPLTAAMPALHLALRGPLRRCARLVGADFVACGWFPAHAYPGETRPDMLSQDSGGSTAYSSYSTLLPKRFAGPPLHMDAVAQPHLLEPAVRFLRYFLRCQPFLPPAALPCTMRDTRGLLSVVVTIAMCTQYKPHLRLSEDTGIIDGLAAEAINCLNRVVAQQPSAS